jgi:RNA polymerase sigma-70 factor (ECF subfamily)
MNTKASFNSLVLGMQGNLLSFAMKLTLNREEAEDLVQDTTLKALDNESKFVENTNFKGWMLTIMRNIFINNYRKNYRNGTVLDTTEDLYQLNLSQDSGINTPEGALTVTEFAKILSDFPDDQRIPFSLHLAGYKYDEIAKKLKMPLGTVKSRIFFTRRQLRKILKDYH